MVRAAEWFVPPYKIDYEPADGARDRQGPKAAWKADGLTLHAFPECFCRNCLGAV
jgi:hypothetical protein